jgi:hypothetical protein
MVNSSIKEIFDIVFAKRVPDCCLEWFEYLLREQIWHLEVVLFYALNCKIVKTDEFDREIFECGYWRMKTDWSYQGFKELQIKKGCHQNLHQAVHCLHDKGIGFDNINIEQTFRGFDVDVEGEIKKEKEYIVIELGELSTLNKFRLVQDKIVREFWFDRKNWMYCLSQTKAKIGKDFRTHTFKYYKSHCESDNSYLSSCLTYGAFDCLEILKEEGKMKHLRTIKV